VLVGFAGFSLWQLRRARHQLTASEQQARRAAEEDALTGLPHMARSDRNHASRPEPTRLG
jgi:hypothetical protein